MAHTAATWPWGKDRSTSKPSPASTSGLARQRRTHRLDRLGRQVGEVGQRLVLHLAVLPVRAAQQGGLVDLVLVVPTRRYHSVLLAAPVDAVPHTISATDPNLDI